MLRFLLPTFSFYQDWYWWALLAVVLGTSYLQGVGFNLEQKTGIPRPELGWMYYHILMLRPVCWIAMLVLSGWVSVLASIVAMFLFSIFVSGIVREHARLMVEQSIEEQ